MIPPNICYWQELIERDDSNAFLNELPVMIRVVGLKRIYQAVVYFFTKEAKS